MRTLSYTVVALVAFAANSVLCRVALRNGAIDAATFSTIRLATGALTLFLVTRTMKPRSLPAGSWPSAGLLFLYAAPFSFAYTTLTAGTGALILFGCVQLTMMAAALRAGERPNAAQWSGLGAAVAGLIYLLLPGLAAPPPVGAALMALAGCSWGLYSLRGRGPENPFVQTGSNFVRTVPLAIAVNLATASRFHAGLTGVLCASASGALASGLGYVAWYAAVRGLTSMRAAVVQLAVPIVAAVAGVVLLGETTSARLALSTVMVLGGIGLALVGRERLLHAGRPRTDAGRVRQ